MIGWVPEFIFGRRMILAHWNLQLNHPGAKKHLSRFIPFVVGAVINPGNCLDLLQRENLKLLQETYLRLKDTFLKEGKQLPANRRIRGHKDVALRDLDCAVINSFHTYWVDSGLPAFDTVRAAFWEGEELYPDAGFRAQSHIQICVRNPNCIKGYFRPLKKIPSHPLPGGA